MCRGKVTELEEAEKHMTEATARFRQVMSSEDAAEAQNVPDIYLEPIRQVVPLYRGGGPGSAWIRLIIEGCIWIRIRSCIKVKIQKLYRLKIEPLRAVDVKN